MARGRAGRSSSSEDRSSSRASALERISKEEVYNLIKAALAELLRYDEPYSYGIAEDAGTDNLIVYFDLPRVSPLQFNVTVPRDVSPEAVTSRIKQTIEKRLIVR
jgi:hypothetical protein